MVNLLFTITNTGAASYQVFYRIKGSSDPWNGPLSVTAVAGATTPLTVSAATPNDYEGYAIAICADGSTADPSNTFYSVPTCAAPNSINASLDGVNFLVQYNVPLTVGSVQLLINYPNGGTFSQIYPVTDPGVIIVPVPASNYGDYFFQLRSVCNQASAWYSAYSNQVQLTIPNPNACTPPEIGGSQIISNTAPQVTYRFTLSGATGQVRVVVDNNTTGTQQILTQTVTSGTVDVSLPRGSLTFNYTISIFNICATGTDNIGDAESVLVPPTFALVNTAGWTVGTGPDTTGLLVTVQTNSVTPSATRDCAVVVRYACVTSGYAYCNVTIPANQTTGQTHGFLPACSVDNASGVIVSAQLI